MTSELLLAAALMMQPSFVPPPHPQTAITVRQTEVHVTAYPPERRRLRGLILLPKRAHDGVDWPPGRLPRAQKRLEKHGLQATFDPPDKTFHIVVTLDDGTRHLVPPIRPGFNSVMLLDR